jgi:hypothetical protein
MVEGRTEPVWEDVVIRYVNDHGETIQENVTLVDSMESGIEGGFYRDLVPFLDGKIKNFVSMHETSKVVKVLELIAKSHKEGKYLPFK